MNRKNLLLGVFLVLWICACAGGGFDSVKKTRQLQPGMSYQEVVALLGEPETTQFKNGKWIATFWLHQQWKGNVPYELVFDPKTKTLISWAENEQKYTQNQKRLEKTFAPLLNQGASGSPGPNDAALMQKFAGYYYSFSSAGVGYSGGTERKLMLCPDGRYYDSAESGYSGGAGTSGAWGTASQGSGGGRWSIQGNMNNGTITFSNSKGTNQVQYKRCASDCVYFGSVKFAYAGPPNCQ